MTRRLSEELLLASVIKQPQMLFVLWAVKSGLCAREADFHVHFGDGLPASSLVSALQSLGFLQQDGGVGVLQLTDAGNALVAHLVIPRQEDLQSDPALPPQPSPSEEPRSRRIMIIDDTPVREIIRDVLLLEGYTVLEWGSGIGALHHISEIKPDLVMIDMMLPGMRGIDLVDAMHEQPGTRNIPIILTTAHPLPPGVIDRLDSYHLVLVVKKPFGMDTLLEGINDLLRQHKWSSTLTSQDP